MPRHAIVITHATPCTAHHIVSSQDVASSEVDRSGALALAAAKIRDSVYKGPLDMES